mmetsp:Transcript_56895/g.107204  ORF Transcript_56895/g.107204 Transcript_56895/m.107204 type:complete len:266 (-) Transcript_56895:1879-2676(-)
MSKSEKSKNSESENAEDPVLNLLDDGPTPTPSIPAPPICPPLSDLRRFHGLSSPIKSFSFMRRSPRISISTPGTSLKSKRTVLSESTVTCFLCAAGFLRSNMSNSEAATFCGSNAFLLKSFFRSGVRLLMYSPCSIGIHCRSSSLFATSSTIDCERRAFFLVSLCLLEGFSSILTLSLEGEVGSTLLLALLASEPPSASCVSCIASSPSVLPSSSSCSSPPCVSSPSTSDGASDCSSGELADFFDCPPRELPPPDVCFSIFECIF